MEAATYELIFEGIIDDNPKTREELTQTLIAECNFNIDGAAQLLRKVRAKILEATHVEDLLNAYRALAKAGGKVAIVNSNSVSPAKTQEESFDSFFKRYSAGLVGSIESLNTKQVELLVNELLAARRRKSQIFFLGNGGSAANASHMVNDFGKHRFTDPKYLFRVIGLSDNVSWITATANDEGYEHVFTNQLKNLLQPNDVVLAISSSGNSKNAVSAVEYANSKGAVTFGIVGFGGGVLGQVAKHVVDIPTKKGQYGFMEDVTSILCHAVSIFIFEQDSRSFNSEKGCLENQSAS